MIELEELSRQPKGQKNPKLRLLENNTMTIPFNSEKLKSWFASKKRDLPWRKTSDPYSIWISEVMLQQTQVSVVIPYYLKWIERFPTIRHLAGAPLDEVIKCWEGLGYYSRARHLHEASKYLIENFDGFLPAKEEELKKIKGLGPYTIGAILSFAFHQRKAAVDGNVVRVLSRYYGIEDDIGKSTTIHQLRQLALDLLPDEESWIVNEALIELGATVCQRKANCRHCPLQEHCVAFRDRSFDRLPFKSKKIKIEYLYRSVAVIQSDSHFLVARGKQGAVMSDLYEFPYIEMSDPIFSPVELQKKMEDNFELQLIQRTVLSEVDHGFTRYQVHLYPVLFTCERPKNIEGLQWLSHEMLKSFAFSSGHRRIFQQLSCFDWLPQV